MLGQTVDCDSIMSTHEDLVKQWKETFQYIGHNQYPKFCVDDFPTNLIFVFASRSQFRSDDENNDEVRMLSSFHLEVLAQCV